MGSNDDLLALGAIGVLAVGAYFLLYKKPTDVVGDIGDVGDVIGGGGVPTKTVTAKCRQLYNGSCCSECASPLSSKCTACKIECNDSLADCGKGGAQCTGVSCGALCAAKKCSLYKPCCNNTNHPGGCAACGVGGFTGGVTTCGDLCARRECTSFLKLCGKYTCSLCDWSHRCGAADCDSYSGGRCVVSGKVCPAYLARALTGRVTYSQQPWHQKITRS